MVHIDVSKAWERFRKVYTDAFGELSDDTMELLRTVFTRSLDEATRDEEITDMELDYLLSMVDSGFEDKSVPTTKRKRKTTK